MVTLKTTRRRAVLGLAGLTLALGAMAGAMAAPAGAGVPVLPTLSGTVRDGDTGKPIPGLCAVFFNASQDPAPFDGQAMTDTDGQFSFTPATSDPQTILIFRPSGPGDCASTPLPTGPVPEWYRDIPVDLKDPFTSPRGASVQIGPFDLGTLCMGENQLFTGTCDNIKPSGPGEISGTVVTTGNAPVAVACVYAIGEGDNVYSAMTDTSGKYAVTGLPLDITYYVGFVPPFDVGDGPCETSNGPPPKPAEGELQPVWYVDKWVDLADPGLNDPRAVAAAAGAIEVKAGQTTIDACLTAAAGTTVPRPACVTSAAAAPTQEAVSAVTSGTLPKTGSRAGAGPEAVVGVALLAAGAALVGLTRRRRRAAGAA